MNRAEAEEFLKTHRQAVLAVNGKAGWPHLTNVLAVYDDGKLIISIAETRIKYRHLQRDPRLTALFLGDNFWQYLTVEGTASFTHMPEAMPGLRRYYELASGKPHPDWADYERAMAEEKRVLLTVEIERMYPITR